VVKATGKPSWIKIRQDNHFLDCEMLNAAAARMERVDLIQDGALRAVEEQAPRPKRKPQAAPMAKREPEKREQTPADTPSPSNSPRRLAHFAARLNRN
jgi:phage terminase large subunit GpA-like protein